MAFVEEKIVFEDEKLKIVHVTWEREGTSLAANSVDDLLSVVAFIYRRLAFPLVSMHIEKGKNVRYTFQKMLDKNEGIKPDEGIHKELQQEGESQGTVGD